MKKTRILTGLIGFPIVAAILILGNKYIIDAFIGIISIIAIIPSLVFKSIGGTLVGAFSATGLLIVVSVAIEFDKSLEAQMLMKSYKGFLK